MSEGLLFVARRGPAYQPDPNAVPANPVVNVAPVGENVIEVVRANPAAFDQGGAPETLQDIVLTYDGSNRLKQVEGSVDGVLATLGYNVAGAVDTVATPSGTVQLAYDGAGNVTNLTWA